MSEEEDLEFYWREIRSSRPRPPAFPLERGYVWIGLLVQRKDGNFAEATGWDRIRIPVPNIEERGGRRYMVFTATFGPTGERAMAHGVALYTHAKQGEVLLSMAYPATREAGPDDHITARFEVCDENPQISFERILTLYGVI